MLNRRPARRVHASPKGQQDKPRDAVEATQDPPSVPLEDRIGAREDQEEMQIDHRHENSEKREWVNQERLGDDLRPVIAPHEGADRHDADREKQLGRIVIGPLPEHPGPDGEDQQLLQETTRTTGNRSTTEDTEPSPGPNGPSPYADLANAP